MCSGGGTGTSTSPPGERVVQPDHGLYNTLTTPFHAPDNPPIDLSYLSPLSPAPRDVFDTVIGKWRTPLPSPNYLPSPLTIYLPLSLSSLACPQGRV